MRRSWAYEGVRVKQVEEASIDVVSVSMTQSDFECWVRPHVPYMRRLAAALGTVDDADDVVQDALLRAWQKHHTYNAAAGSARSWLLSLTADQLRRRHRRPYRQLSLVGLSEAQLPTVALAPADPDLAAAIGTLAKRQREVIVLHYFVDCTTEQVAAILGCSASTVKSTLVDARRRLQTLLGERP